MKPASVSDAGFDLLMLATFCFVMPDWIRHPATARLRREKSRTRSKT